MYSLVQGIVSGGILYPEAGEAIVNMKKVSLRRNFFLIYRKVISCKSKKRSAGIRTEAYKVDVASDRHRRENVPRHILCYLKISNHP